MNWTWFHRLGSPPYIYSLAARLTPWFGWPAALLILGGLYAARALATGLPAGRRLSNPLRPCTDCMDVHHGVYNDGGGRCCRPHLAYKSVACGRGELRADRRVVYVLRAGDGLVVGRSRCGEPDWEWDPRLTSELILLFLYLGYMGLRSAMEDVQRADRASAVLAIVGIVNVPIIHYSVTWWNSLHQAPSVMRFDRPTIATSMLIPLLMMLLGFTLFFVTVLLIRLRGEILSRERTASWIREAVTP